MTKCITNSDDVMRELVRYLGVRRQMLVPRVSWGLINWGECDLLALSDAGYLTEYEIKISAADIRREWKKRRWENSLIREGFMRTIKRYYMAVPHKIMDVAIDTMPDFVGGGVIVVDYPKPFGRIKPGIKIVQKARTSPAAIPLTDREKMQMGRLGTMRYWGEFMVRTAP